MDIRKTVEVNVEFTKMSFKVKKEYKLEDGSLILERIREYFNVPLTATPTKLPLNHSDSLYVDVAAYFKQQLENVSCRITTIAILRNREVWERYQQFKNLKKQMEAEARSASTSDYTSCFNDTVLFHGTHPDNVHSILEHGLDSRLSRQFGNCGPAIYLSPSFEKCDLFASRHNNVERCLIVCVTALGKIYDNTKFKAVDPHTKFPPKGYDSVKHYVAVADEYVVYENVQVLPILVINYERENKTFPDFTSRISTSGLVLGYTPHPPGFPNMMLNNPFPVPGFANLPVNNPFPIINNPSNTTVNNSFPILNNQPNVPMNNSFSILNNQTNVSSPSSGSSGSLLFGLQSAKTFLTHSTPSHHPLNSSINSLTYSNFNTGSLQFPKGLSPLFVAHSSALPPSSNSPADYTMRKARATLQQWIAKINLTNGSSNFSGAQLADKQYWPNASKSRFPNLASYLDWVMSTKGGSTRELDFDLVEMLRKLDSCEGIVYARRHHVESTRAVNWHEALILASDQRLQEAYSTHEGCTICADSILTNLTQVSDITQMKNCPHVFHKSCIEAWLSMPSSPRACPNCKTPCHDPFAAPTVGPMPDGDMAYIFNEILGAWFICYGIPNATQVSCHPSPGMPFKGTTRIAVCPIYLKWGPLLFIRLVAAFYYHHTFTVGTSLTTNCADSTTWNGIHHKTMTDGPFGFPDPTYEDRVSLELDAKGIMLFLRDLVQQ
ncbi:10186_t:CDS:2 [Ambispora gerdemannii]|uniref:Poly [ADP-ribose] polymerase n=1 Tax=Ambispora gerdemannii TaxID=144530 RepID=A0A9N9BHL0_9GLOM|nr:10186_t:CDS:2 [Ambispora gerdemannii]